MRARCRRSSSRTRLSREAVEGGGARALPEPDLLRPRPLRLRGGGALLLRQVGAGRSTWPRRRCSPGCRRARSGCRRASTRRRPRRASATCSGRWPTTASSSARPPSASRPSRSAWRARPAAARGLAAEEVDVVGARPRRQAGRVGRRSRPARRSRPRSTRTCRSWRAPSLERGLEELDARQGFRGPSGHVAGKALDSQRRELGKTHATVPQGLGDRRGDRAALREGRDQPDQREARQAVRRRRRGRPGESARAAAEPPARRGKGKRQGRAEARRPPPPPPLPPPTREGVVDFSLEPRYAKGPKPLADRFKPGDLVRVRLAEDRPHSEDGPLPLALELGPQAAMVVMDPTTREVLALVGGYDYHAGGFDRVAARAPAAGLGVQAGHLRRRRRGAPDHAGDDPERRARGLRALEAAELREGRVPRPGPRAHRAGPLDQHGRDQGAVGRRPGPGARLRDARRDDVADPDRRRAVAGARVAGR